MGCEQSALAAASPILTTETSEKSASRPLFNNSYSQNDIAQQKHVGKFFPKLVDLIVGHYEKVKRPIGIVDVCCGYGLHSHFLHEHLAERGVEVSSIVGVDISQDLVEQGRAKYASDAHLTFKVANIESSFNDIEEYDVAFSIFGLHWMERLPAAFEAVVRSLRPDGLFMAVNYMESRSFFRARKEFPHTCQWKERFEDFELQPFHFEHSDYLTVFEGSTTRVHYDQRTDGFDYSRAEIIKVCQSWMQEVRHLVEGESDEAARSGLAKVYLGAFLDSLPADLEGYLTKKDEDTWNLSPFIHFYAGHKL